MARAKVRVTVLCEDRMHEHFVRKLCEGYGLTPVRVQIAPKGRGSAEEWVRKRFPDEVKRLRQHRHEHIALITITDGDRFGVTERLQGFASALAENGLPARTNDDHLAILVPTWSIETWLLWLCGEVDVGETVSYKNTPKWRQAEASPTTAAERYFVAPGQDEPVRVPALCAARAEMQRLVDTS